MYIVCTKLDQLDGNMSKRMTTAQARRDFAKVLRSAERGIPVEVMRNGQPIAVVISMGQYREVQGAAKPTLSAFIAEFRASVDPRDLEGPDPWADVRDRSAGREVDLG